MNSRMKKLGYVLAVVGLGFLIGAGVALNMTMAGNRSLQKFAEAQNVTLSYNEEGQLVDRGATEGADAIMTLLTDDWGYPVVMSQLDPADPLVNTPSEYMYQMATIGYHTLHGSTTIVLDEDVEYNGETFKAGTYDVPTEGKYWTDFDREHPLEGPARAAVWTGTAHGLIAELGVGTVTASALQLATALAGLFAGVGLVSMLTGFGLVWVAKEEGKKEIVEPRVLAGSGV
ncbi:MAG: hypothetical protein JJE47_05805 [Acidimicrobiia bacterium]|nr:hypothetical protein [Acidimicrobiia bacterium]